MALTNAYLKGVYENVEKRNPGEPEFLQAVKEVLESFQPVVEQDKSFETNGIIDRIVEPERFISFRVSWVDDNGNIQVNRGYRCQFNSAIGPYKGGLRFHPSVNASIIKFLGFEQCFKNSLTGLPIGGGKGGSDFDPRGRSDGEIMRFCQSFMTELYRHIGASVDVPAGDIGVGAREIGYLYGQYKRICNNFENGVLTGKSISYGGSLIRPEATGYGAVYFCNETLNKWGEDIKGKTFAVSGFGNVAWGAVLKINELGGKVLTISGPDGYVYDKDGVTADKAAYMLEMRASGRDKVQDYADKFGAEFHAGEKPWGVKVDVVMPCATQNEVGIEDAKKIVANGTKFYIEVANMPTTAEAVEYLQENNVVIGPSKAVNAGGVAVSALEMCQNSMRYSWTAEEVDAKLKGIMTNIFNAAYDTAEKYGDKGNLIMGANIAGFVKIADAMKWQGVAY
ncbi:MAG: NADP-specific glutamate dehydrogenase [Oscillospiraceae bacterium]|nr:NADP-specific glutamate dehydrogenase [Oscillospiraceae bacterium]